MKVYIKFTNENESPIIIECESVTSMVNDDCKDNARINLFGKVDGNTQLIASVFYRNILYWRVLDENSN